MLALLDNPAVQGGVAPLLAALAVAAVLARTRFAWLAIGAGYATMVALTTGFATSPLTVARKIVLIGTAAPLIGAAIDAAAPRARSLDWALASVAGAASTWVFLSILRQKDAMAAVAVGAGLAVFVAALVAATLRLRDDGLATGAAGLGLGLAVGICGLLSASIGALLSGVSIAAACGAVLLVQVALSRSLAAGRTGALAIGVLAALVAGATLLLAALPWFALPLLVAVPLAARLPAPRSAPAVARAAVLAVYALLGAALPVVAAWYAARGSLT